jgi:hypothetical protein
MTRYYYYCAIPSMGWYMSFTEFPNYILDVSYAIDYNKDNVYRVTRNTFLPERISPMIKEWQEAAQRGELTFLEISANTFFLNYINMLG